MTDIVQMSKDGKKFYPQTHVQAVIGLPDSGVRTNLIVAKTIENNTTLDGKGNIFRISASFTTDYIPVVANQKYTVTIYDTTIPCISRVAYYDSSKNFISREPDRDISASSSEVIVIPSGTSYIRLSPGTPDKSGEYKNNFKLEKGPTATDYSLNPLDVATNDGVQTAITNALGKVATINVISQADYDKLADKSGIYFIKG